MYLETVKKITGVESEMDQRKAEARVQVQQQLAQAEKAGKLLLANTRAEAKRRSAELLEQTEQTALEGREATLRAADEDAQALRVRAESQMARAAEEIVRRVVER